MAAVMLRTRRATLAEPAVAQVRVQQHETAEDSDSRFGMLAQQRADNEHSRQKQRQARAADQQRRLVAVPQIAGHQRQQHRQRDRGDQRVVEGVVRVREAQHWKRQDHERHRQAVQQAQDGCRHAGDVAEFDHCSFGQSVLAWVVHSPVPIIIRI
jgi:hypothetical protein